VRFSTKSKSPRGDQEVQRAASPRNVGTRLAKEERRGSSPDLKQETSLKESDPGLGGGVGAGHSTIEGIPATNIRIQDLELSVSGPPIDTERNTSPS